MNIIFITLFLFFTILFKPINIQAFENILRTSDETKISFNQMINELKKINIIFIGEYHDKPDHHKIQFHIIKALHQSRIPIVIGLEMFASEYQNLLNKWVAGDIELKEFLDIYKNNWSYEWDLYKDIFIYAKDNNIPLIGLNVPRDIPQRVSRYGLSALTVEELKILPSDLQCEIESGISTEILKMVFKSHDKEDFIFFCQAQMIWDKTMAKNIIEHLKSNPDNLMIVLAGIGHAFKKGIPYHIRRQSDFIYRVILPEEAHPVKNITNEFADYLIQ